MFYKIIISVISILIISGLLFCGGALYKQYKCEPRIEYISIEQSERDEFTSTINRIYDDIGRVKSEVGLSLLYTGQLREQLIELRRISEYTYNELGRIEQSMVDVIRKNDGE